MFVGMALRVWRQPAAAPSTFTSAAGGVETVVNCIRKKTSCLDRGKTGVIVRL